MSKASLFFLFNHKNTLYIVDNTQVQDVPKPRELIRRFSTIEQIRQHALHLGLEIANDTARERTKHHTPEGIERIRLAKLGDNHPANNPMYGKAHRKETRIKMSQASFFKERRRWCVSPEQVTTTIPVSEPLPEGWQWGRFYDKYRPDPIQLPDPQEIS